VSKLRGAGKKLCRQLLDCDPSIVEIVQFGSSIYIPERARDIDLLVFTERERRYEKYLDFINELDLPFNVDVVVKKTGEPLKNSFGYQVLGAYKILFGSGEHLQRATAEVNPTFEDAYKALKDAREALKLSKEDPSEHDWLIRISFNGLFDAPRMASMAYLATEETRWSKVKSRLPPHKKRISKIYRYASSKILLRRLSRKCEGGIRFLVWKS
jgi:predicted nucleotidyltransferase